MSKSLTAFLILIALAGSAHAFGLGRLGAGFGKLGAIGAPQAVVQPTGKILLADGVSHLLLADGVSKLCRAGGC
ncbi:MAG TPA: hypothetical protein VIM11_26730 [Tepidisphaeraceae bacterium]|jgi:hypothetical protein